MAQELQYFIRPECGRDDRIGEPVGPFPEFLQLTYEDLRCGPDGEIVAQYNGGDWFFVKGYGDNGAAPWSDVVIYATA